MEALKHQGKRWTKLPDQWSESLRVLKLLVKNLVISGRQIPALYPLNRTGFPILDMVDEGRIAFRPAVELST